MMAATPAIVGRLEPESCTSERICLSSATHSASSARSRAYDESRDVAKAYHAACTPDFFLFGADRRLVYRGQLDGARPGNDAPLSGHDLRAALDAVLAGKPVPEPQLPNVGCSIKWKPGNEPDFVALRHAAAGS